MLLDLYLINFKHSTQFAFNFIATIASLINSAMTTSLTKATNLNPYRVSPAVSAHSTAHSWNWAIPPVPSISHAANSKRILNPVLQAVLWRRPSSGYWCCGTRSGLPGLSGRECPQGCQGCSRCTAACWFQEVRLLFRPRIELGSRINLRDGVKVLMSFGQRR